MNSSNTSTREESLPLLNQLQVVIGMGPELAEIRGIAEPSLKDIYAFAYDFYKKGQLDEAELFFKFLCIYDLKNPDYLRGYAAVCQLKQNYQLAYDLYYLSFTIDSELDYQPVYFMGQCQLGLKNLKEARECFEIIVNDCRDEELVKKASLYLELLQDHPVEEASV